MNKTKQRKVSTLLCLIFLAACILAVLPAENKNAVGWTYNTISEREQGKGEVDENLNLEEKERLKAIIDQKDPDYDRNFNKDRISPVEEYIKETLLNDGTSIMFHYNAEKKDIIKYIGK